MDYLKIIDKYFSGNEKAKDIYLVHVSLVTAKALKIARGLGLSVEQLRFIEEAGMLHDIGIVRVKADNIYCHGKLSYVCHITEGEKILLAEGYPRHARVCATHTGVGLTKEHVIATKLPIEPRDYLPESIEEEIISYADLFFTKEPSRILLEATVDEVRRSVAHYNKSDLEKFNELHKRFGNF